KYDRRCCHLSTGEVQSKLASGLPHTVRLKMPDDYRFSFQDEIRGLVEMDSSQSDDQVIIKSDGFPTYHLAAVADDHYMKISHVIRGEEWLSSTPKHLWLYQCLGWEAPVWVHLPLILNPDRTKLSKRMNDVSVDSYIEKGYLKEALLNFIALLGWHTADDREIYSLEELCEEFSLNRVSKAGAVFDLTKLDWMNAHYLRSLPVETIVQRSGSFFSAAGLYAQSTEQMAKIISIARERCALLPDLVEYSKMFLEYNSLSAADQEYLISPEAQRVVQWFTEQLAGLDSIEKEACAEIVQRGLAELAIKAKAYYTPLRLALIRTAHGPDLPSIIDILGVPETLNRLHKAQI
ncbi:MAG: glutamate--tRNA ligase, partial [Candidatus Cloacimonadaceae bacterium]|nr:glutamate--tRNA ligase [Candidatus Cloacimonadaceae bacterium]